MLTKRVHFAQFGKTFVAKNAGIAPSARRAIGPRIVTTARERVVDPQLEARLDDFRLGHADKGGVNLQLF